MTPPWQWWCAVIFVGGIVWFLMSSPFLFWSAP